MGGPTKAQLDRKVKAVDVPNDPDKGVYVTKQGEEDVPDDEKTVIAFKGPFECQLTPANSLVILEMVPDVANVNKGLPIPTIRRFINGSVWAEVVVK